MIEIKEFMEKVEHEVKEALGMGYSVESRIVPKMNGLRYHGLCIRQSDSSIAATIRLEPYYDRYLYEEGRDEAMKEITGNILQMYRENANLPSCLRVDDLESYARIKGKIMFKLINAEYNKELLELVPHIPFLDLSIVFYLALDEDERGNYTALLYNTHREKWRVSTETLYQQAMENTQRDFPATIKNMAQVMRELGDCLDTGRGKEGDAEPPFYVLSNRCGLNGAGVILYKKVLTEFAAEKRCGGIFILPSSCHEVLLLPDDGAVDGLELKKIVESVNQTEVLPEDRLSNHVYRYSRAKRKVSIVA